MEKPASTVTFGDSKSVANPDVSCPKCGGTKPTCCSCPEPKYFSLTELAGEFTQAAINAHVGFKHETRWHDCNYARFAKWREMIDTLNAAVPAAADEETGERPPAFIICSCRAHGLDPVSQAYLDRSHVLHTLIACRRVL